MTKEKSQLKVELVKAKEIIDNMIYAIDNDKEFPVLQDFSDLGTAEKCLTNCGGIFLKIYKP